MQSAIPIIRISPEDQMIMSIMLFTNTYLYKFCSLFDSQQHDQLNSTSIYTYVPYLNYLSITIINQILVILYYYIENVNPYN